MIQKTTKSVFIILLTFVVGSGQVAGQEHAPPKGEPPSLQLPPPVTTTHTLTMEGKKHTYDATVGYLVMRSSEDEPQAFFFYTSYKLHHQGIRPITFCFNGGPGSSSFYLHLLTIGPRTARLTPEGNTPPPPPRLRDNPHSWLAATDIVMVDPVGTGFSRTAPGVKGEKYWGTMEDARSVADFIRSYLTEHRRWLSPVYIAGESYGGIRGALLARELQSSNRIGLDISGLIYISPALEMAHVMVRDHDALGLALYFPTYCTTAWFHGRVAERYRKDFSLLEQAAREFALRVYLPALLKGSGLSRDEMHRVAEKMVPLTGLPLETIVQQNLRITSEEFRSELLRNQRRQLDRLDARFTAGRYDLTQTLSPLVNYYLREELKYRTSRPYTNTARLFGRWHWDPFNLSVLPHLAETMNRNPYLKVFCAAGYYDFACPFFVIDHGLNQLQLDEGLHANITRRYYQAGHMVYTPEEEHRRFSEDVKEFIRSTSD